MNLQYLLILTSVLLIILFGTYFYMQIRNIINFCNRLVSNKFLNNISSNSEYAIDELLSKKKQDFANEISVYKNRFEGFLAGVLI